MPGAYLATKDSPLLTAEWQAWCLICCAIVGVIVIAVSIYKTFK